MGRNLTIYLCSCLLSVALCAQNSTSYSQFSIKSTKSKNRKDKPNFPFTYSETVSYRLEYTRTSLTGEHEYYQQYINNIPVYGKGLKVHYRHNGEIILESNNCVSPTFKKGNEKPKDTTQVYVATESGLELARVEIAQSADISLNNELLVNDKGVVLYEQSHNHYLNNPDSLANVHVFYPDPITSSKSSYGGNLTDNNDQNNSALQNEIFQKKIKTLYQNDTFRLENDYIKMADLGKPSVPVAISRDGNFFFNRSESGFEDVNVFYHITQLREHMEKIGHENLGKTQILVDAHGTTSDNSFYASNFNPGRILFGIGGVDDAEDATPIIHEYGHALSDYASPKTNIGIERSAIDEGICDYMAASYKKSISDYNWENVYAWDGHNEFWDGRITNSPKTYPEDFVGTPHSNGEVISSALMDINFAIGRDIADQLFFESLYYLDNDMSATQYGDVLLIVEKELYNGVYNLDICPILTSRGLVSGCSVGLDENESTDNIFRTFNSNSFSYGNGDLIIESQEEITSVELYNLAGNSVEQFQNSDKKFILSSFSVESGLYLIKLITDNHLFQTKIIKF